MSFAIYPSLSGQTVMITGGASGIGEQIVRAFAAQGSRVGFLDINAERGAALESELRDGGNTATFFPCDLKDADALKDTVGRLIEALGPVAVLVNNAANDDRHDWTEVTPAFFDELFLLALVVLLSLLAHRLNTIGDMLGALLRRKAPEDADSSRHGPAQ